MQRIIIASVVSGFAVASALCAYGAPLAQPAQAQSLVAEGRPSFESLVAEGRPSFECGHVHYLDEKLICRDAGLGRLDNDLADAYRRLLLKLPETGNDRAKLYKDEEAFVLARRRCGANRGCIEQQYRDRIIVLEWQGANTDNR